MKKISDAFRHISVYTRLSVLLVLAACSSGRDYAPSGQMTALGEGGYYKVGRPYTIKGVTYYPEENYSYDETGIASWYGSDFHAKKTANGEVFNKHELTAAHKTLPMPSLARVTNLENGRSIVVRVNDRGPFSGKRIIDVSQRAAQLLGFERKGLAKVRVQVMAEESRAIADAMRSYGTYGKPAPVQVAQQMPAPEVKSAAALPPPVERQTLATFKPAPVVQQMPVTGPNNIYVQLGAFTNIENARRLQAQAAQIGQTVLAQADVKGTTYYRVRLGPLTNVASADNLMDRVMRSGLSRDARIVVD